MDTNKRSIKVSDTVLRACDIPDEDVRQWFLDKTPKHRNWLMCVEHWGVPHFRWALNTIPAKNDNVVILILSPTETLRLAVDKININDYRVVNYHNDLQLFRDVIQQERINTFYSHASFHSEILKFRQSLSIEYAQQVLPIWFEGGFFRHVTFQHDSVGWNAWGSLATQDISQLPELTAKQKDFVHEFVVGTFLPAKLQRETRRQVSSQAQLRDICKTTKPICLVPLQVDSDSTIVHFAPPKYRTKSWAFNLAQNNEDMFFIIKDHPKQTSFEDLRLGNKGDNWLCLSSLVDWDTQTMAMNADLVACVNSTVGFESLFWTPVIAGGDSIYTHGEVCYKMNEFRAGLPPKRESDIYKFLHYAITRYHYTPSIE